MAAYVIWPNSPGVLSKKFETRLGLDLVGGVQVLLEADLPEGTPIDQEAMNTATSIVENRVNDGLGVNEPIVQQAGDRRVVVELPGETDPESAVAVLKQTGLLEFIDLSELAYEQAAFLEQSQAVLQTDYGLTNAQATSPSPTIAATETITSALTALTSRVYHTVMTGADLETVAVVVDPQTTEPQIEFQLSSDGAKIFSEFTSQHVGQILAIALDKRIISAPRINSAITDGSGVIQGNFTVESANTLAIQLRYGSLPIPLKVVEIRTVGPSLGQDSLDKSLLAGGVGFIIVALFMLLYYRLLGSIADLSIIYYAAITFAIFRFIPVTLTLPGIAGFLLSTGSALDANILIFERIKEELRAGKPLRQAVDLGWRRALPSIRDANIATIITSLILFWFGSSFGATIVKGFSVTLLLGVMVSLFTSLIVTRVFMETVLKYFKSTNYAKWFGI